jgi:hypothetical protein
VFIPPRNQKGRNEAMLGDHIRRLERRARELGFPVDRDGVALEGAHSEFRGIVEAEFALRRHAVRNCLVVLIGKGQARDQRLAPESDNDIAPDLTRSTQMLWFTNFLSRTEYGFITRNEERDLDPLLIRLLEEQREEFKALEVDIDAIKSRTNI